MPIRYLISCEHGGNHVPQPYLDCFAAHAVLLESHRGHDPGALAVARELARALDAQLIWSCTSRLLIDLNRSPGHPKLYSELTRALPDPVRREIFEQHYLPYRSRAEKAIAAAIAGGARLIHISSHSFTPVLDGVERNADAGLLYDPARPGERLLCREWLAVLKRDSPALRVRRNYPYTGKSDGLTAWLRRQHAAGEYIGIELEINQRIVEKGGEDWHRLRDDLVSSLVRTLEGFAGRWTEP